MFVFVYVGRQVYIKTNFKDLYLSFFLLENFGTSRTERALRASYLRQMQFMRCKNVRNVTVAFYLATFLLGNKQRKSFLISLSYSVCIIDCIEIQHKSPTLLTSIL